MNGIDVSATCASKLFVLADMHVPFRVERSNDVGYRTVLTVEPHSKP